MEALAEGEFDTNGAPMITPEKAIIYGQRVAELAARLGRETENVTPEDVVEDAKDKDAPYHLYFDWNNAVAAHKHRINQARKLIGAIVVKRINQEGEEEKVRAFHHVKITNKDGSEERAYVRHEIVFQQPPLRDQVISDALHQAEAWRRRWRSCVEMAEICEAIEKTSTKLNRRGKKGK